LQPTGKKPEYLWDGNTVGEEITAGRSDAAPAE
jgi:hypothetical protein